MTNSLRLKFLRLQAMSTPEMLYRLWQHVKNRWEKMLVTHRKADEAIEAFLLRQNLWRDGTDAKLEEVKIGMLDRVRRRDVFAWQSMTLESLQAVFDRDFAEAKDATFQQADEIFAHRFRIFDRQASFPQAIDWHWDPLAEKSIPVRYWTEVDYWQSSTVTEVKYVWELNRHQHFVTLAKAYLLSQEERYAEELFRQWQDWIAKNPFLFGINWTSSLECALRLVSWTWALQMAKHSPSLSPRFYAEILRCVEQHARFIGGHLSRYSSANNHLLGEALGLIYAGCYFPELKQAANWRRTGFDLFHQEFPEQVHPDGVGKEQAIYYQLYLFRFGVLTNLAAVLDQETMPPQVMQRMENMAHFITSVMDSEGNVPAIGDEDGGQALRLSELPGNPYKSLLATAAALFGRGEFKERAQEFDESSFWLCGTSGKEKFEDLQPAAPRRRAVTFPQGGYVVLSPENQAFRQRLVFDCGPLGFGALAAHGHADALSFTLTVNGEPLLIDCGTYLYLGAGKWRNYFRSTAAHNTVTVDGLDQSVPLGPFQWGRKARTFGVALEEKEGKLSVAASHDGYRKSSVIHHRRISLEQPDLWQIEDQLKGHGLHQAELYFHLSPCDCGMRSAASVACTFEKIKLEWQFSSDVAFSLSIVNGQENLPMGWHSPAFGVRMSHPVIILAVKDRLPLVVRTRIKLQS